MGNVIRQVLNRTLCHLSGLDCVQKVKKKIGNYQDKISKTFYSAHKRQLTPNTTFGAIQLQMVYH